MTDKEFWVFKVANENAFIMDMFTGFFYDRFTNTGLKAYPNYQWRRLSKKSLKTLHVNDTSAGYFSPCRLDTVHRRWIPSLTYMVHSKIALGGILVEPLSVPDSYYAAVYLNYMLTQL